MICGRASKMGSSPSLHGVLIPRWARNLLWGQRSSTRKRARQTLPSRGADLYYSKMFRCLAAFRLVIGMALVPIGSAAVSHASPSGEDASGQCSFVLTPPEVVQVSGESKVLVTMHPGPCTTAAVPNSQVVCVSVAGDGSPGHCAYKSGQETVRMYYFYRPGATYVVKAQGCADSITPPYTLCQNFGPTQTTL